VNLHKFGIVILIQSVLLLVANGVEIVVLIFVQLVNQGRLGIVFLKQSVLVLGETGVVIGVLIFLVPLVMLPMYIIVMILVLVLVRVVAGVMIRMVMAGVMILVVQHVNQVKFGIVLMKQLAVLLVEIGVLTQMVKLDA